VNVFLIFEMIPDSTDLYFIPDVSDDDIRILDAANRRYVNNDSETRDVLRVCDFVAEKPEYCEDPSDQSNCKWSKYKLDDRKGMSAWSNDEGLNIQKVYIMGFVM
jgi:hypothetical protein